MLVIDLLLVILALYLVLRQISAAGAAFTDSEGMQLRMQAGIWETATPTELLLGSNCTHSMGFWKTHPEAWPVEKIVLGGLIVDLEKGLALMESPPEGQADRILARQLLAAKLNALFGAETFAISEVLANAVEWLTAYNADKAPERESAILLAEMLDAFNRGEIGPGVCAEESDNESETPRELLGGTPKPSPEVVGTPESTPTPEPTRSDSPEPTETEVTETETPTSEATVEPTSTEVETEEAVPTEPTESMEPTESSTVESTSEAQPTVEPTDEGIPGTEEAGSTSP